MSFTSSNQSSINNTINSDYGQYFGIIGHILFGELILLVTAEVALIGLISTIMSSALTWIFAKRKQDADISSTISQAASTSVESLLFVVDGLRTAIEESRNDLNELKEEMDTLIAENLILQQDIRDLKQQNELLHEENQKLMAEIKRIRSPRP